MTGPIRAAILLTAATLCPAQDGAIVFSLAVPSAAPVREALADGRLAMRLEATQAISGGVFTERGTQVFLPSQLNGVVPISTNFRLENGAGSIEGVYSGTLDRLTQQSTQTGTVSAATKSYAIYLGGTATYRSFVTEEGDARATLTIQPPPRFGDDWIYEAINVTEARSLDSPKDSTPDADGVLFYFLADHASGPGIFTVPFNGGEPALMAAGKPFVDPRGIAISPSSGTLFIADPRAGEEGRGRVFSVSADGASIDELPQSLAHLPQSLVVTREDADDVLYFTGRDPRDNVPAVFRLPASSVRPPVILWKGEPLQSPDGIAVARNGDIYIADRAGSVFRISGRSILKLASGLRLGDPAGIALTQDEGLLLASALDRQTGRANLILIDTKTFALGVANADGQGAGGLHRAAFGDIFAWTNAASRGDLSRVIVRR
ncbi:MAG: hypothetical protein HYZ37_08420 [Candidatus Solibacter usitatus]|nr:hypothetical protein [Candidatus Solibacter usitatus]